MGGKFIDRTGQVFGRLTVVARAGTNALKKTLWQCQCVCGAVLIVPSGSFVTGNTTSCGCYLKEKITKHGGYQKSSYHTWRAMMRRCYNLKDKDYRKYGAVGVTVCAEWQEYLNFEAAMGEPIGNQTLDRIDTYGNYTLENCRWASITTQNRNIRVRNTSKSGVIGVSQPYSGKWMAKITLGKKAFYSNVCNTIAEAATARKELEQLHWGHA